MNRNRPITAPTVKGKSARLTIAETSRKAPDNTKTKTSDVRIRTGVRRSSIFSNFSLTDGIGRDPSGKTSEDGLKEDI
jgi:hypothetical protein